MGALGILSVIGGFAKRIPWQVYAAIGALILIAFAVHAHRNAVKATESAFYAKGASDTRTAFLAAQAKADAAQRAKNAAQAVKQSKIDQEKSNALAKTNADIDARANAISVRHEAAVRRGQGSRGAVPSTSASASQSCPATTQDGLPWELAFPLMVQAQKNEAQLNAVLDWEAAQDKIAP